MHETRLKNGKTTGFCKLAMKLKILYFVPPAICPLYRQIYVALDRAVERGCKKLRFLGFLTKKPLKAQKSKF